MPVPPARQKINRGRGVDGAIVLDVPGDHNLVPILLPHPIADVALLLLARRPSRRAFRRFFTQFRRAGFAFGGGERRAPVGRDATAATTSSSSASTSSSSSSAAATVFAFASAALTAFSTRWRFAASFTCLRPLSGRGTGKGKGRAGASSVSGRYGGDERLGGAIEGGGGGGGGGRYARVLSLSGRDDSLLALRRAWDGGNAVRGVGGGASRAAHASRSGGHRIFRRRRRRRRCRTAWARREARARTALRETSSGASSSDESDMARLRFVPVALGSGRRAEPRASHSAECFAPARASANEVASAIKVSPKIKMSPGSRRGLL